MNGKTKFIKLKLAKSDVRQKMKSGILLKNKSQSFGPQIISIRTAKKRSGTLYNSNRPGQCGAVGATE
jgi:hypothetical protein